MITLTGTFQYDDGTPLDGTAKLNIIGSDGQYFILGAAQEQGTQTPIPNRYEIIITNGSISSIVGFDTNFTSTDTIWGNSEISPPDTLYKYWLFDAVDRKISGPVNIQISSGPYDLFSALPSSIPTSAVTQNILVSNPPSGSMAIKNFYVNSSGKVVVEYDDAPV
jgi:hypothetical protein